MEIILLFLTGTLMGALFVFAFYLGTRYEAQKPKEEEGITVNEQNKKFVADMMRWMNYNGGGDEN